MKYLKELLKINETECFHDSSKKLWIFGTIVIVLVIIICAIIGDRTNNQNLNENNVIKNVGNLPSNTKISKELIL